VKLLEGKDAAENAKMQKFLKSNNGHPYNTSEMRKSIGAMLTDAFKNASASPDKTTVAFAAGPFSAKDTLFSAIEGATPEPALENLRKLKSTAATADVKKFKEILKTSPQSNLKCNVY
jgi:hypothetical protein